MVSRDLVERLAPAPGDVVLELAAGIGQTSLLLAERGARHTSSRPTSRRRWWRRRSGSRPGWAPPGSSTESSTPQNIDLPDASVDAVLCRWGLMLFGDPVRALAEIRRVLRPGGRFACSVWATPEANPWASVAGRAMAERGRHAAAGAGQPGMFTLGAPAGSRSSSAAPGSPTSRSSTVEVPFRRESFDEYWDATPELGGGIADAVAPLLGRGAHRLPRGDRTRRGALPRPGTGFAFPARCQNAVAS